MNKVPMTVRGADQLREEVNELKTVARPKVIQAIAEARSHGDLRENADYDAAKNEQGMMEARIRQLKHILETAEIREAEDTGVVQIGTIVTVVDSDGDSMEYFVAPTENKIPGYLLASPSGPLGSALLGAAVGDEVSYEAPGGTFSMRIESVKPFEG